LFLKLNNITYEFANQSNENSLKIEETEHYFNKCREQGLTSLSSNTVAMIANNILKNIDGPLKPEELS